MKNVAKVSLKPVMYVTKNMKENSLMHLKKTPSCLFCSFSVFDIETWSPFEKLGRLEFTSVIVGFASGFTTCLLITACPHFLKRYDCTV
jgi:hypothetical protein